jgi:hypothetical protein
MNLDELLEIKTRMYEQKVNNFCDLGLLIMEFLPFVHNWCLLGWIFYC